MSTRVVRFAAFALFATALLAALTGAASASTAPAVSFGSVSVSGQTATITYSINRASNQVASRSCSLTGPTTSTACGAQTASKKTSTTYQVSLSSLASGAYGFAVKFVLTDGGKASGSTSFTVSRLAQTISFTSTNPSPVAIGDPTYTPTAAASSGLPVAITLDASSSGCSLSAGVVSFTAAGTCVIDANQAGSSSYSAAAQVQQSISVNKVAQTVSFTSTAPSSATVGGATYTPTASASSGLPVAITLDASSSGCSLSGGVVSFTATGACLIDANQAGNSTYGPAAQVQQSITVNKSAQTISFTSTNPSPVAIGDPTYTPTATASSGLPVTITLDGSSSGCSLAAGVVSFTGSGTCLVDANQSGDSTYSAAAQVQQSITVGKVAQTISFTSAAPSSATVGGATYTPTASASSGLPVTITVDASSSSVCAIDGTGAVSFTAAGTCVIDADQSGDSTYAAAQQVQQSFTVGTSTGGGGGGGGGGGCAVNNLAIVDLIIHSKLPLSAARGRFTDAALTPWSLTWRGPSRIPDTVIC